MFKKCVVLSLVLSLNSVLAIVSNEQVTQDTVTLKKDYSKYIQVIASEPVFAKQEQEAQFPPFRHTLDVPFAAQAPEGNWDMPYQEACEEMSLILVHYYLQNKRLSKKAADLEVQQLTSWVEKSGLGHSISLEQTAIVAEKYYGYSTTILEDPTIEDIKTEIANGNPVIVPAAGRKLENPYFVGEGPWYHMLVITGYDESKFITNEVGTIYGHGYSYDQEHLLRAIHNWNFEPEATEFGTKVALVLHDN